MTLRIEIQEQPERERYWAEVEMGGMIARRKDVWSPKADGLSGILAVVYAAAAEIDPRIMPLTFDVKAAASEAAAGYARETAIPEMDRGIAAGLAAMGAAVPIGGPDLDTLRSEAEAAGVRVDRRWGEARLREEIASAGHECAPTSD